MQEAAIRTAAAREWAGIRRRFQAVFKAIHGDDALRYPCSSQSRRLASIKCSDSTWRHGQPLPQRANAPRQATTVLTKKLNDYSLSDDLFSRGILDGTLHVNAGVLGGSWVSATQLAGHAAHHANYNFNFSIQSNYSFNFYL